MNISARKDLQKSFSCPITRLSADKTTFSFHLKTLSKDTQLELGHLTSGFLVSISLVETPIFSLCRTYTKCHSIIQWLVVTAGRTLSRQTPTYCLPSYLLFIYGKKHNKHGKPLVADFFQIFNRFLVATFLLANSNSSKYSSLSVSNTL